MGLVWSGEGAGLGGYFGEWSWVNMQWGGGDFYQGIKDGRVIILRVFGI